MADPIAELIDRLLASGKLSPDTRGDLQEYRADLGRGELAAEDRRYVQSLAQRLLGVGAPAADFGSAANDDEDAGGEDLWEVGEDPEIAQLRERLEAAEARIAELEAENATLRVRLGDEL